MRVCIGNVVCLLGKVARSLCPCPQVPIAVQAKGERVGSKTATGWQLKGDAKFGHRWSIKVEEDAGCEVTAEVQV